jgi:hypothetical protein
MRRVLDALGKLAAQWESEKRQPAQAVKADWRASFIMGQKNVIWHYRRLLATQRMPPAERQAVLDRIKRLEDEIRALEAEQIDRRQLQAA